MDLGLKELSDDQLLELLQEACGELGTRDGYVRELAQSTILSEAEKMQHARTALESAARTMKALYIEGLQADIEREVREAVNAGEVRLSVEEETALVLKANADAKARIVAELEAAYSNPSAQSQLAAKGIAIRIASMEVQIDVGPSHAAMRCALNDRTILGLINAIRELAH